jgi:PAS domain S-box-containing protein
VSKVAKDNGAALALKRLLEVVPDAMLAITPSGEVAFANRAAAELFGYTHGELIGKPAEMLEPVRFRNLQRSNRAAYFQDPRNRRIVGGVTLLALRKDGNEFLAESSHRLVEDGDLLTVTIRDISDRARAERQRPLEREVQRSHRLELAQQQPAAPNGNGNGNRNGADRDAIRELRASRHETIERLAMAVELRDPETGRHVNRIAAIGAFLGRQLGFDDERAELLLAAAPMHDVGKIGISDEILLKPGKLSRRERQEMESHTTFGHQLLSESTSELMRVAASIALTHHERWDGNGYPLGLAGDEIPLEGRIVAVADVFDALLSDRPYRPALSVDASLAVIRDGLGTHFDPEIGQILLDHSDTLLELRRAAADLDPPRPGFGHGNGRPLLKAL